MQGMPRPARHEPFDCKPAVRIIDIILRQGPDAMHVVGQNYPCIDDEWPRGPHEANRLMEAGPYCRVTEDGTPPVCDDREEKGGAGDGATIAGHGAASYYRRPRLFVWLVKRMQK